jgi:hypothetical protein
MFNIIFNTLSRANSHNRWSRRGQAVPTNDAYRTGRGLTVIGQKRSELLLG